MFDIYTGAYWRLATARRAAWQNAAKGRTGAATCWRTIARENARRRYQDGGPQWGPVFVSGGDPVRFVARLEGSGLVVVVDNATEHQNNRNLSGYYVDTFGHDSQHGAVLGTRGEDAEGSPRARYFAAIPGPDNDGAFRILWRPQAAVSDAAAMADSWAEQDAEAQREHDAAWQAGRCWLDLGEEIADTRREALQILRDRKTARGSEALRAVIWEKVESLVDSIREARAARERLAQGEGETDRDYHRTFWPGERRLREAFNDGAETAVLAV